MSAAAVLSLLLVAPGATPARALPVFETSVATVRLDVSVMRDGVPVKGLSESSFEVEDEGVRQQVEAIGQEDAAIHAVLALDTSQSVEGAPLEELKAAAHVFVDALRPEDSLSFVAFAECIDLSTAGGGDRAEAHAAIERAHARHTTALHDSVLASLVLADPALGRPLVLMFSDGRDTGSFMSAPRAIALARDSEAVVHAVLPSAAPPAEFLTSLTDETGGRVWSTNEREPLDQVFLRVLDEFRSRYRLRYEPEGVRPGGWHRIKVRLTDGAKGRVRARPGYRLRSSEPGSP